MITKTFYVGAFDEQDVKKQNKPVIGQKLKYLTSTD